MKPISYDNINPLLEECREMIGREGDTESVLLFLRTQGCSIIDSAKILIALQGISLTEAKNAVHFSDTWLDRRQEFESIHDQLENESR